MLYYNSVKIYKIKYLKIFTQKSYENIKSCEITSKIL